MPNDLARAALAENVYAGNAMSRRMFFQYGVLLPRSPFGHVDQSIGKNTAAGNIGLIEPTRHLANRGVMIDEVHNVYRQPENPQRQWAAHSYHGSDEYNRRAVINRYLGYWDANPATMIRLSPRESAPLYVEMMGGAGKIMAKRRQLHAERNIGKP